MIKDPMALKALDLARTKNGLFNFSAYGGDLPEYAISRIQESGASTLLSYPNLVYSYFRDPERLGLPNIHVSKTLLYKVSFKTLS